MCREAASMSLLAPDLSRSAEILIDGAWVPGRTDRQRRITNPATLAPVRCTPQCGLGEIAAAANAARRSQPEWNSCSASDRAALIERAGSEIARQARQLAYVHAQETGQVYCESLDCVHAAAAYFRKAAQSLRSGDSSLRELDRSRRGSVVATLPAPDHPLVDWGHTVSRLLAFGSSIVCLPPPDTPLTMLAAAACLGALPPGVINVVTADEGVMQALAQLEGIDCVVRGGTVEANDASRRAHREAADCIFIAESASLDLAVAGATSLRLYHSGQRRGQCPRIYVEQPVADSFAERLHEFVALLEAGDPSKPGTDLGPLASPMTLTHVEDAIARALRQGARLKLGGRRYHPWGLRGYFVQPTILIDRRDAALSDETQIAGPVIVICPVSDIAAAIRHRYRDNARLLASLFAEDPATLVRSLRTAGLPVRVRVAAGMVERICENVEHGGENAEGIVIEHVAASRRDWFPYERRPLATLRPDGA